jgi:uncharacterized protein (DUF4415 family)
MKRVKKMQGKRAVRKRKITVRAAAEGGKALSTKARAWMAEAGKYYKPIKKPVTVRLDADVLAWFKAQGKGYQTRINRALRSLMLEKKG